MSDSIKFSPTGAFSFYWNQAIDRKDYCVVRLGKSLVGLLKTLFCGHR